MIRRKGRGNRSEHLNDAERERNVCLLLQRFQPSDSRGRLPNVEDGAERVQELEAAPLFLPWRYDREFEEVHPGPDGHGPAYGALIQHRAGYAQRRLGVFAAVAELERGRDRMLVRRSQLFVAVAVAVVVTLPMRDHPLHPLGRVLPARGRGRAPLGEEDVRVEEFGQVPREEDGS